MQPISDRLESLYLTLNNWAAVASKLDLSVSTLMMVRRGDRKLSRKSMARLAAVEGELGIQPRVRYEQQRQGVVSEIKETAANMGVPVAEMLARVESISNQVRVVDQVISGLARLEAEARDLRELLSSGLESKDKLEEVASGIVQEAKTKSIHPKPPGTKDKPPD